MEDKDKNIEELEKAKEVLEEPKMEVAEEDNDEMPEPQTKVYEKYIRVKPKFIDMLKKSIGTLGYNQNIGTPDTQIKVNQLFKIIEENGDKMGVNEMNQFITLISFAPWNLINPLMKAIETPEGQLDLWEIYEC